VDIQQALDYAAHLNMGVLTTLKPMVDLRCLTSCSPCAMTE